MLFYRNSPADWCGNGGIYGKSTKFSTVIVLDELINLSCGPIRDYSRVYVLDLRVRVLFGTI